MSPSIEVGPILAKRLNAQWSFDCSPGRELGKGSVADVYLGTNHYTQEGIAIKKQRLRWSSGSKGSMLRHEYGVYQELGRGEGIPTVYDYCRERYRYRGERRYRCYLVMEQLGPSLYKTMQHRLGRPRLASSGLFFSLEEVVSIGEQLISALQLIHNRNFIHRDVQPKNIVYDRSRERVLLIDYAVAEKYRNPTTHGHLPWQAARMVGSPIFASLNSHRGHTVSQRDDMESLGYVLVYLVRGQLPWQHLSAKAKDLIAVKKSTITIEGLCGGLEPLCKFFRSVKRLVFGQEPDYNGLRRVLCSLVM
ncbi:hypothetical protein N7508_011178 [Penicillium antarcticum]|uniref:uncharacterized protein n=1 Tax=Penicillium antarcticum TaxID=416450 RepID=UPI00239824D8|nr:uncharacterized protein N7508_011178 [Penicillium antarcticum]KAJ5288403.1 hypothetical protein N7508_011178 [Penicillium antarcticum]